MTRHARNQGFTLIELSIALVVIGLVVGGVLVGRDLVESARIRGGVSQVEEITATINTFRLRHNCIPGDCPNATKFFGDASDGDGNGKVNNWADSWQPAGRESRYLWHHLQLAGLLRAPMSNPTLLEGFGGAALRPGVHVPLARFGDDALLLIAHDDNLRGGMGWGASAGGTVWDRYVPYNYGHYLLVGGGSSDGIDTLHPFTTEQARRIDVKFDDGYATGGKILAPLQGGCYPDPTQQSHTLGYTGVGTGKACSLVFTHIF